MIQVSKLFFTHYSPRLLWVKGVVVVAVAGVLWGCLLSPKKGYPGPERPKKSLSLIAQTDFPESRPIFILLPGVENIEEVRVDELGIVVLPGSYRFTAKLYHYEHQESMRIQTMTIYQGEAGFPVQQPVLRKVLAENPYKEIKNIQFEAKSGLKYGVWCDGEKIRMIVLGPY